MIMCRCRRSVECIDMRQIMSRNARKGMAKKLDKEQKSYDYFLTFQFCSFSRQFAEKPLCYPHFHKKSFCINGGCYSICYIIKMTNLIKCYNTCLQIEVINNGSIFNLSLFRNCNCTENK